MARLSPRERAALDACLERSRHGGRATGAAGADRFVHQVKLGSQDAWVPEGDLPEPLRPLVKGLSPNLNGFNKAPS